MSGTAGKPSIRFMAMRNKQQHVVAVPLPAQGHLNPLMRFCQSLAAQENFIVTFVDFDPIHARLQQLQHTSEAPPPASAADTGATPSLIRRANIPIHGLDLSNNFNFSLTDFFSSLPSIAPYLEQLILSLSPPVTCLLSDFNITLPTQDVADKLGIPRIVLYTCCASRLLLCHYLSQGEHLSLEGVMDALAVEGTKRGEVFCEGLPGLLTLHYNDIPHYRHMNDDTQFMWEWMIESWQVCNARAHAVAVNSFHDLEKSAFDALSGTCDVPVYDVGLWVEALSKDNATSLWKEDTSCITWLDQQPHGSVLYISFGSVTILSKSQFEEFQDGLISSKQRFLWVLRPGLVADINYTSCVANILSKCDDNGLVISWAPQLQVLAHPSVGGFLTHCGWNSTSESITNGVPMLCWPYFADQLLNARCIQSMWKVGLGFKTSEKDGAFIARDEIDKAIRALMEGEEGKVVRKNAKDLREKSLQCFKEGGSSYVKIQSLVQSLLK